MLTVELPTLIELTVRFTLAPTLTAVETFAVAGKREVVKVPLVMLSAFAAIAIAFVYAVSELVPETVTALEYAVSER